MVEGQWLRDCMEEWRDYGHLILRAKWTMDGATTLEDVIDYCYDEMDNCVPGPM